MVWPLLLVEKVSAHSGKLNRSPNWPELSFEVDRVSPFSRSLLTVWVGVTYAVLYSSIQKCWQSLDNQRWPISVRCLGASLVVVVIIQPLWLHLAICCGTPFISVHDSDYIKATISHPLSIPFEPDWIFCLSTFFSGRQDHDILHCMFLLIINDVR